jgi:hypothetical protein
MNKSNKPIFFCYLIYIPDLSLSFLYIHKRNTFPLPNVYCFNAHKSLSLLMPPLSLLMPPRLLLMPPLSLLMPPLSLLMPPLSLRRSRRLSGNFDANRDNDILDFSGPCRVHFSGLRLILRHSQTFRKFWCQ